MELNLLENIFDTNEDISNIDHQFESVIEIEFDTFTLEYNQTLNLYTAIPNDKEDYDDLIIEGTYINEDDEQIVITFDKDTNLFGYLLTIREFTELKESLKNI
jgi:hypothetical protein